MNKKLTSEEALIIINRYYKDNGYRVSLEDWDLKRKYKNFNGLLCRDFINEKASKKAILVENLELGTTTVIENENYKYFLKMEQKNPDILFAPIISNDGLSFVFYSENLDEKVFKELLLAKMKKLFIDNFFVIKENKKECLISISKLELSAIIAKLKEESITFKEKLEEKLEEKLDNLFLKDYKIITPDMAWVFYQFPEYIKYDHEKSINEIFSIISKKHKLEDKDLSIIKVLLQKINIKEFNVVKDIALSFHLNNDERLVDIFEKEESKIKSKNLIQKLIKE